MRKEKFNKSNHKLTYAVLLSVFSMGIFGLFSGMEINFFLKSYGLIFFLQAGFLLIYFGFYRHSKP